MKLTLSKKTTNNLAICDEQKIVYCEQCKIVEIKKSKSIRRHGKKVIEMGEEKKKLEQKKQV